MDKIDKLFADESLSEDELNEKLAELGVQGLELVDEGDFADENFADNCETLETDSETSNALDEIEKLFANENLSEEELTKKLGELDVQLLELVEE